MSLNSEGADSIRKFLVRSVEKAHEGDPATAAEVAVIIHRFPEIARETGLNTQYSFFLGLAARSEDAEFLVNVGEAVGIGKLLAKDEKLAVRFFTRADQFSPFMGAFMLGRIAVLAPTRSARMFMRKAASAGHVPSAIWRSHYMMTRLGLLRWLYLPIFAVMCSIRISRAVRSREGLYHRLWRYRDVFPSKNDRLKREYLPQDRVDTFQRVRLLIEDLEKK
jgi:hypothetical protein